MSRIDTHQHLIERIPGIVDEYRAIGGGEHGRVACSCGTRGLSDHSRHVAEQLADGLDLKADGVEHINKRVRCHALQQVT